MTTQNNKFKTIRTVVPKLMNNFQILYQNGEISAEEKNQLCQAVKEAMETNNTSALHKHLKSIQYGALLPCVIEECIQLIS